jgi:hypothetical protein
MSQKTLLAAAVLAILGCHSATDPTPPCYVAPIEGNPFSTLSRVSGPGTCGTGAVSVTSLPNADHTFSAVLRFRVLGAKPSTKYYAQRAADFGRALSDDGICQRADGLAPWGDAPDFITFPIPFAGDKFTLTTDASGDASQDFNYNSIIPAGTHFDVEMRVVDNETTPTSELRSGCMRVIVQ